MTKMASEESEPAEYIEITIRPENRVDLGEFTRALDALNAEYRQWLREHPSFDHTDQDLKLYVEKISEGSIVIWLTKSKEMLIDSLGGFYKEILKEYIQGIISDEKIKLLDTSIKKLTNIKAIIKWDIKFKYKSKHRKLEFSHSLSGKTREETQNKIKSLLGEKDVHEARENIKFIGFHAQGSAKVIAPTFSDNEVKTFLTQGVRKFFIDEEKNFLHPEKEYLVEMEVTYKQNEIESYLIKEVIGT